MTQTLWLRFSDDTNLPDTLDPDAQVRLERIFDDVSPDSEWNKAMGLLGFKTRSASEGLLKWRQGSPYINWSNLVSIVGAGAVEVTPSQDGGYTYKVRYTPQSVLGLMASQWKISRFLIRAFAKDKGEDTSRSDQIVRSLALGQALLALTLRLPKHTPETLAQWLRDPSALPRGLKKTVEDILQIQKERTKLSDAWTEIFPVQSLSAPVSDLPAYFWNAGPDRPSEETAIHPIKDRWKGLPIAGEVATGRAILVGRDGVLPEGTDPMVLIFARARPETVEFFPAAAAVLYAEGGAMSHACTVAREDGVTCITAIGRDFIRQIGELGPVWLSVDGANGEIKVIK
jgi:phosphohistidine swiveling domain-containing protein